MKIEELKERAKYSSYVVLDANIYDGLMHLRKFAEMAFQGWANCSEEESITEECFVELVKNYLTFVDKLSERLDSVD